MLAFLSAAAPAVAVRPRPSLVESSFSIHALAVQASPEPSPSPSPLPAANTDATGMCGLELVYTPVGLSGAIEAFAFRADGKIVHSHARSASAAVWTPFRPVGDEDGAETRKFASGPTVVRAADGRLEVVARGMDGALYVKYQLAPNGVRGWGLRSKNAIRASISRKQLNHLPILTELCPQTCGALCHGQTVACAPRSSSDAQCTSSFSLPRLSNSSVCSLESSAPGS